MPLSTYRALFVIFLLGAAASARTPPPEPPEIVYGDLFSAVADSDAPRDSRLMTTGLPREAPAEILARYRAEKPATPEALHAFVEAHFLPAPQPAEPPIPQGLPLRQHIDALWDTLTRHSETAPDHSSLLPLPHPYIVPGGQFVEIYYWDSYFTMLGLVESGRGDLARGMLDNFAYLIDTYGHIPNGNRSYYLSRSQPPFFFKMVELLAADDPGRYLPQLKTEYAYWMQGAEGLKPGQANRHVVALDTGVVLNRYWDERDIPRDEAYRGDRDLAKSSGRDPAQIYRDIRAGAESGWDFSSRWFEDGRNKASIMTTEILPVDLNSLMFGLEKAIADACGRTGDRVCAADFTGRAKRRQAALNGLFWSDNDGFYVDYRWTKHQQIPRLSAATLYPLFVQAASGPQADAVAHVVQNSLLQPGGLVTTPVATGEQWDSPNGWAPLQWIAVDGLRRYGHEDLASEISRRWVAEVTKVYGETGKLFEKYDVVSDRPGGGGEYPLQDGFGWTNGVTRRLMTQASAGVQARTVKICMTDREFLPISSPYFEAPGQHMARLAIERQGDKAMFAALPWRRCVEELRHGGFDGAIGMAATDSFRGFMRFPLIDGRPDVGKALGDLVYVAVRAKGSAADWDGEHFLNLQRPAIYNAPSLLVAEKMHQLGIGDAQSSLSEEQMLVMLTVGRADIAVGRKDIAQALAADDRFRGRIEVLPVPFVSAASYLAFRESFIEPEPNYLQHVWDEIGRQLASKAY